MQSLLGFTYRDLVIASIVKSVVDKIDPNLRSAEMLIDASKSFGQIDEDSLTLAFCFVASLPDTFASRKLEHRYLKYLLESPEYFPECSVNFADGSHPDLHSELFEFWKDYAIHIETRKAIDSLSRLAGISRHEVESSSNYAVECLFHRGMERVDADIKAVVELYNSFKTIHGFSPALPTPNVLSKEEDYFCYSLDASGLCVYYPTLSGVIYFEGSTKVNNPILDNHINPVVGASEEI